MKLTEAEYENLLQARRTGKSGATASPMTPATGRRPPIGQSSKGPNKTEAGPGRILKLGLILPIKTVSEANEREHWRTKHKRKTEQQAIVECEWLRLLGKLRIQLPCMVKLTRIGPNALDDDNLVGAFKHVRDQIARILGVDDGSDQVKFEYAQAPTGLRVYQVEIGICPCGSVGV
jgi:hypothetical protein